MNPSNHKKRRYFLSKSRKKSKQVKMDDDDVATDYKLQLFLADVQKFSDKTKEKKEDRLDKEVPGGKSNMCNGRRGLFENGVLSKPSVKGVLGLKNKARLIGSLEKLVAEETSVEPSFPVTSKLCQQRSNVIAMCKERDAATPHPAPSTFHTEEWWDDLMKKRGRYNEELSRVHNNSSYDKREREKREEEIYKKYLKPDKKLTEEQYLELFSNLGPTCNIKEELLKECEKRLLEKILKEDAIILNTVQQLQIERKCPPTTEDRSVQTDLTLVDSDNLNITHNEQANPVINVDIFTPPKNEADFPLPIPETGQPHPSSLLYHLSDKGNSQTFFDPGIVEHEKKKKEISFNFECSESSTSNNTLHFLTPPKKRKSSFFDDEAVGGLGDGDRSWPKKAYLPPIVTPPSPGRKYSQSPHFLDLPQFQHVNKGYAQEENSKRFLSEVHSERMYVPKDTNTSRQTNPSFPKRHKTYFSPHRLC